MGSTNRGVKALESTYGESGQEKKSKSETANCAEPLVSNILLVSQNSSSNQHLALTIFGADIRTNENAIIQRPKEQPRKFIDVLRSLKGLSIWWPHLKYVC